MSNSTVPVMALSKHGPSEQTKNEGKADLSEVPVASSNTTLPFPVTAIVEAALPLFSSYASSTHCENSEKHTLEVPRNLSVLPAETVTSASCAFRVPPSSAAT